MARSAVQRCNRAPSDIPVRMVLPHPHPSIVPVSRLFYSAKKSMSIVILSIVKKARPCEL